MFLNCIISIWICCNTDWLTVHTVLFCQHKLVANETCKCNLFCSWLLQQTDSLQKVMKKLLLSKFNMVSVSCSATTEYNELLKRNTVAASIFQFLQTVKNKEFCAQTYNTVSKILQIMSYLEACHSFPWLLTCSEHLPECDTKRPNVRCRRELQVIDTLRSTPVHDIVTNYLTMCRTQYTAEYLCKISHDYYCYHNDWYYKVEK